MRSIRSWLQEYALEEAATAQRLGSEARELYGDSIDAAHLISYLYSDKLGSGGRPSHAYQETGSLIGSTLLYPCTVKEVFPVTTPRDLETLVGISAHDLVWLNENSLVLPLIQHPMQYEALDYLHPLLSARRRPPSYEIRDRVFYDIMARGRYEELLESGYAHPVLGRDVRSPRGMREPYEEYIADPSVRWRQRNVQRYAALCSLAGQDVVEGVLEYDGVDDPDEVFRRLFELHRRVLHPVTQGLFGTPHRHDDGATADADALGRLETTVVDRLGLRIPRSFSREMVEKSHALGFPDRYARLEEDVWKRLNSETAGRTANVDDFVHFFVELDESMLRTRGRGVELVERTMRIGGVTAGAAVSTHNPALGVSIGIMPELMPSKVAEKMVDMIHRVFGRRQLPWHYWRTKSIARRI